MRYAGWMSRSTSVLTFSSILQNAAASAWSRCVSSVAQQSPPGPSSAPRDGDTLSTTMLVAPVDNPPKEPSKFHESDTRIATPKPTNLCQRTRLPGYSYVNPNTLSRHSMKPFDPGRSVYMEGDWIDDEQFMFTSCRWGDPSHYFSQISPTSKSPTFLTSITSRRQLYNVLIQLVSPHTVPRATLPQLLDYYQFNREFWSTRSFNFLISLSLQHASFGIATRLLETMAHNNFHPNLETQKLYIRLMAYTGRWDLAWRQFTGVTSGGNGETRLSDMHETLWLEFLRSLKRGTFRKRETSRGHSENEEGFEKPFTAYARRYVQLMTHRPPITLAQSRPKVIYFSIQTLFQLHMQKHALSMAKSYLASLPLDMDRKHVTVCLDIINLLVVFGSNQRGVKRFHQNRRILMASLSSHPSLKPTSETLFLLLSNLRSVARCGTLAFQTLVNFKRRWGSQVEDRQVRRRVARLALKEGRHDIVRMMFGRERSCGRSSPVAPNHTIGAWTDFASHKTFLPRPSKRRCPNAVKQMSLWQQLRLARRRKLQKQRRLVYLRQRVIDGDI